MLVVDLLSYFLEWGAGGKVTSNKNPFKKSVDEIKKIYEGGGKYYFKLNQKGIPKKISF